MKLYPSSPVVTVRLNSLRGLSAVAQAYSIWRTAFQSEGIPLDKKILMGILQLDEEGYKKVQKEINQLD